MKTGTLLTAQDLVEMLVNLEPVRKGSEDEEEYGQPK